MHDYMIYAETTGFHLVCFLLDNNAFIMHTKHNKQKIITVWRLVKHGNLLEIEYIFMDFIAIK